MAEEWDWALQQNQTAYTVAELGKETGVAGGALITLDLEFMPVKDADGVAFKKVLSSFGYNVRDGKDGGIAASISDIPFTFDAIWTHEERTTKMALGRGYQPEGWGFWEP
ncbi:MAG: hypothetical protein V3V13_13650 [Paracoccaceae bacterium]